MADPTELARLLGVALHTAELHAEASRVAAAEKTDQLRKIELRRQYHRDTDQAAIADLLAELTAALEET